MIEKFADPEKIRFLSEKDLPEFRAMVLELARFGKLEHEMVATIDDYRASLFGRDPSASVLVVPGESDALIGYAVFYRTFSTFEGKASAWLEDLYVRPDFRGIGWGRALLESVIKNATNVGATRLEWCVMDWNQNAIDLYQSIGGEILDDHRIVRLKLDP